MLKKLLTNTPILKIEDPDKEFGAFTDACKRGLGGFMMKVHEIK